MANGRALALAAGLCLTLSGCSGSVADALGFGKRAPDEFAVVKREPLIMPPDYDLRPPDPNARPPVANRADAQARAALTGVPVEQRSGTPAGTTGAGTAAETGRTGESVLIERTAEVPLNPDVREVLADETGGTAEVDDALFERLTTGASADGGQASTRDILTDSGPADDTGSGSADGTGDDLTLIRHTSTPLEDL